MLCCKCHYVIGADNSPFVRYEINAGSWVALAHDITEDHHHDVQTDGGFSASFSISVSPHPYIVESGERKHVVSFEVLVP